MRIFDYLKNKRVRKALKIGHAITKVLRKKVEDRLDESEASVVQKNISLANIVAEELLQNLNQFLLLSQTPNAIGFMAVNFFSLRFITKGRRELVLSPDEKLVLDEVHLFLSQCNIELEKIEVRKDGFIKGNLPSTLLDTGEKIFKKALLVVKRTV